MNETPISERLRISFVGKRNAGKSSLINAVTNQSIAIVSDVPGTTTDPVSKTMELFPLGPVLITDTAGIDDEGSLGKLRIKKTKEVLNKTDITVIVIPSNYDDLSIEKQIIAEQINKTRLIVCMTKADIFPDRRAVLTKELETNVISVCSLSGEGIDEFRSQLGKLNINSAKQPAILDGICSPGSRILLVTPIDSSAPKGRMILPQVMTLRDCMDKHGICMCVQPDEYRKAADIFNPDVIITDSQAFSLISSLTPAEKKLTSFSILLARAKGDLKLFVKGAEAINKLTDNSKILVAEACTHHVQKDDIATTLLPQKLCAITQKELQFDKVSGTSFPENLSDYSLIIHCGGCMISGTQMYYRQLQAENAGVPMTNFGVALAKAAGILSRASEWLI